MLFVVVEIGAARHLFLKLIPGKFQPATQRNQKLRERQGMDPFLGFRGGGEGGANFSQSKKALTYLPILYLSTVSQYIN
jgi:hypothetical protein